MNIPTILKKDIEKVRLSEMSVKARRLLENKRKFRIRSSSSDIFGLDFNQSSDQQTPIYRSLEESLVAIKVEADTSDLNPRAEKVNLLNLRGLRLKNKDLFSTLFRKRQLDSLKLKINKRELVGDVNLINVSQVEVDTKSKLTEEEISLLNQNVERRMMLSDFKKRSMKDLGKVEFEQDGFMFQSMPVTNASPEKPGNGIGKNKFGNLSTKSQAGKRIKLGREP